MRRECEGAGADRKPFDGENPFVERKRREDFRAAAPPSGPARRRSAGESRAPELNRWSVMLYVARPWPRPSTACSSRGASHAARVASHGVGHAVFGSRVESVTLLRRERFRRTFEMGAIHC